MTHKEVFTGQLNLDEITAAEMLRYVADLIYQAPEDADPYIDVHFGDSWGDTCVMRMTLVDQDENHTIQ